MRTAGGVPEKRGPPGARERRRHRIRRTRGASRDARTARRGARSPPRGDQGAGSRRSGRALPRGVARVISVRRPASVLSRAVLRAYVPGRTRGWPDFSRLFVVGDDVGWSIDDDTTRLTAAATRLAYDVAPTGWARFAPRQSVFHPDHFGALRPRWLESSHRLGLSYFHGRPGTPGYPEFDEAYETLRRNAARVDRVQVTNDEMRDLVLAAGVDPAHVFRIPIGVDIERFPLGDTAEREEARKKLGLPESAFVVGSFQKDGV